MDVERGEGVEERTESSDKNIKVLKKRAVGVREWGLEWGGY